MPSVLETLIIELRGETAQLRRDLDGATRAADRAAGSIEQRFANLGSTFARAGRNLTIGITTPLAALGTAAVRSASQVEVLETSFTTLLGSGERAKGFLEELQSFAAGTPFRFPELARAGQSLVAFGVAADETIPTLRRIGDVSAGIGASVGEIAEIYGKARVQGRLFAEDINQLTGRGIPIIQELATQFGVAESEVRELVSSGQVGFENLEQAFVSLTSEGGKFFGLTSAQAETTAGKISTLQDNIGLLGAEFGEVLLPFVNRTVTGLTNLVRQVNDMDAGTRNLVVGVAAVAAALGPVSLIVGQLVTGFGRLVGVWGTVARTAPGVAAALRSVSSAAFGIPGVLAAAGAALIIFVNDSFRAIRRLEEAANSAIQTTGASSEIANLRTQAAEIQSSITSSVAALRAAGVSEERVQAAQEGRRAALAAITEQVRALRSEAEAPLVLPPTEFEFAAPDTDALLSDIQSGIDAAPPLRIKATLEVEPSVRTGSPNTPTLDPRIVPGGGAGRGDSIFAGGLPGVVDVVGNLPRSPLQVPTPRAVAPSTAPTGLGGIDLIGLQPRAVGRQFGEGFAAGAASQPIPGVSDRAITERVRAGTEIGPLGPVEPEVAPLLYDPIRQRFIAPLGFISPGSDPSSPSVGLRGLPTDVSRFLPTGVPRLGAGGESGVGLTPRQFTLPTRGAPSDNPLRFGGVQPGGGLLAGFDFDAAAAAQDAAQAFRLEFAQVGAGVALSIIDAVQGGEVQDAIGAVFSGAGQVAGLFGPVGQLFGVGLNFLGGIIPRLFGRDEQDEALEGGAASRPAPPSLRLDFTTIQNWTFNGLNPDDARAVNAVTLNDNIRELQRTLGAFMPRIERLEAATGVEAPRGAV